MIHTQLQALVGRQRIDQHIGLKGHPREGVALKQYAALARIEKREVGSFALPFANFDQRRDLTAGVAFPGLELNGVCAEVGEHACTKCTCRDLTDFENMQSG